jgi:hypothetical protein
LADVPIEAYKILKLGMKRFLDLTDVLEMLTFNVASNFYYILLVFLFTSSIIFALGLFGLLRIFFWSYDLGTVNACLFIGLVGFI